MDMTPFTRPERTRPGNGKTTWTLVWDRSSGQLEITPCLKCRKAFRRGLVAWTFAVGREILGIVCPRCLTPAERAELEEAKTK
jgi:hypothetical protein